MSLSITKKDKEKKSVTMWTRNGFFANECCDFSLEKANLPGNTLLYVNQGYQSYKDGKKMLLLRYLHCCANHAAGPPTKRYRVLQL